MERLFAYDHWANHEVVSRLRVTLAPPRAVRILAHISGAQWLWLERSRGGSKAVVWPDWTLDQCAEQLDALRDAWKGALPSIDRAASIRYTNSKGEQWTSRADDVLMHVILHGAHHRGQIAILVRDAGAEPAYTDYIHCMRAGLLGDDR